MVTYWNDANPLVTKVKHHTLRDLCDELTQSSRVTLFSSWYPDDVLDQSLQGQLTLVLVHILKVNCIKHTTKHQPPPPRCCASTYTVKRHVEPAVIYLQRVAGENTWAARAAESKGGGP